MDNSLREECLQKHSDTPFAALVLNYNHWRDTVACVESLASGTQQPERVVICDNGSSDGSLEQLCLWAARSCREGWPHSWRLVSRLEVDSHPLGGQLPSEELLIIDNGGNLGYAAGNNVGLRLLLHHEAPFIWLLNNDTIVHPEAARALVKHMLCRPRCGLCGTLTRYLESPEIVQCYGGGWYHQKWGLGGLYGDGVRLAPGDRPQKHGEKLDYINGASVFIRKDFLADIGFLEEAYFLYCEELDWAQRAQNRWELDWAPDAEVLHREGLSTGASNRRGLGRSLRSSAQLFRSRMLFAWKFHPWKCPTVFLGQILALALKTLSALWGKMLKPPASQ